MDSHRISTPIPTTVKVAGIEFDSAVDFDGTPEDHHTRYGPDGSLVGLTIVNARWLLEREGEIVLTLPEQKVRTTGLDDLLAVG